MRRVRRSAWGAAVSLFLITPGMGVCLEQTSGQTKTPLDLIAVLTAGLFTLVAAILGTGGLVKYIAEPAFRHRRVRRVVATGLWLSSHELREHLSDIKTTIEQNNTKSGELRDSLLKIPRWDYHGRPDWFVKTGYFCMITAYKLAAFSSWMKIYQQAVLEALLMLGRDDLALKLFRNFDQYKAAASKGTVLWYSYIDAIGEKITKEGAESGSPLSFSEFCEKYHNDVNFRYLFDQLHMFLHFLGKAHADSTSTYYTALSQMIASLDNIDALLKDSQENLLKNFRPQERNRTSAPELTKQALREVPD